MSARALRAAEAVISNQRNEIVRLELRSAALTGAIYSAIKVLVDEVDENEVDPLARIEEAVSVLEGAI